MPVPSQLPPAVTDTPAPPVPAEAAAPTRQQKRVVVPPKPYPSAALPKPPTPFPRRVRPRSQPSSKVEIAQPRSVRADLSTLGERITAKVDAHLSRLESLSDD